MKKKCIFLALFALTLTMTGCGKSKTSNGQSVSLITTFVKGDPREILVGTTPNPDSFITEAGIAQFNDFSLSTIRQFTEKEVLIQESSLLLNDENIENGNEATEVDQTEIFEKTLFLFSNEGEKYIYSDKQFPYEFVFTLKNGRLDLTSLRKESESYPLQSVHYSLKNTGDAFSILVIFNDSLEGKIILSFEFIRNSQKMKISKVDAKYKYLYGPGVLVSWPREEVLNIDICGAPRNALSDTYKSGIHAWRNTLYNRLTIETRELSVYPPFSDLNTHCIYTIDNYLTRADAARNVGSTFVSRNLLQGKIVDADIFIWIKENEKNKPKGMYDYQELLLTLTHETGHLLGLDHQFSGIKSIMSYDPTHTEIYEYDEQAIRLLYPL